MTLLICLLAGPLIGWRLHGGWPGAGAGAVVGLAVGFVVQLILTLATLRLRPARGRAWLSVVAAIPAVTILFVVLSPPPPGELFQMVAGFGPPEGVGNLQAGWDWETPRGYYFRFSADERALAELVRKLTLLPADAFSDTPPPAAPSWWKPLSGPDVRHWTLRDASRAIELSAAGGQANLGVRVR